MGDRVLLTVQELLEATNASWYNDSVLCNGFTSVVTDSRNVTMGSLFIPLIGENQDGHLYIASAVEKGASIVLVQKSSLNEFKTVYDSLCQQCVILIVENTLLALQQAASFYVKKFPKLQKIAVTGSNGKTTVKECIGSVLSQKYSVVMNVGNLNSETGLPLSMFTITDDHEIGLFEMGMNRRGEIKELADVFFPDLALITNIGTAHIGILGTKQAIAEEKKQIFAHFNEKSVGFIFEDESYIDFLSNGVQGSIKTYGIKSTQGIKSVASKGIYGSEIHYENTIIAFPLVGEHNAYNACAAISIGQYFNVSAHEIKNGLESVKPLFGRSEILEGEPTIIQDCYNGSFESMAASLDFFTNLEWNGNKILVLGDMLELGVKSTEIHAEILEKIMSASFELVMLIGENFSSVYESYTGEKLKTVYYSQKTDDDSIANICEKVNTSIKASDIVLFKGSRGIKLERAVILIQKMFAKQEVV